MADRWQKQTINGGFGVPPEERGDCVRACIASILDVPLKSLPNPHGNWHAGWHDALSPLGFSMVEIDVRQWFPPGLWIAQVPSLNLRACSHVLVAQNDELIHDPSTGDCYDDELWGRGGAVTGGWILAALDPARPTPPEGNGR